MPLEPMPDNINGKPYIYQDQSNDLWEVVGYITKPAAILQNVKTGVQHVEIIGCLNAQRFTRLKPVSSA